MEHPSKRQRIGDTAPVERKRRHAEMARRAVTTVSEMDLVDATIFVSVELNAAGVPTATITLSQTLLSHPSGQNIVSVPTAPSVPVVPVIAPAPPSVPIPPPSLPTPAVPSDYLPGSQSTLLPAVLTLPSLPTTPPTLIPPYAFPSTILPLVPGLVSDPLRIQLSLLLQEQVAY
jgi:hypothetical protein